jgi:tetratricopeptide (TPR) repeat protein
MTRRGAARLSSQWIFCYTKARPLTARRKDEGMADATGSGQHKIIDIADILQSLGNKRWTGTLQVISHGRNVYLFFREGVIQHSKADTSKVVLGRALFKLGKLDEADLNLALNDFETAGKKIGQACVELGLVQAEDIKEALAFQAREGVLDLFTWEDVDARFHPNEPPLPAVFAPDDLETRLNLAPMGLLMEAARRADEWEMVKAQIPTLHEVLVSTLPEGAPGMTPGDRRILALVDGFRTASEVADAAPTANFEALKHLAELHKNGVLRRLEAIDLAKVALEAEREKDLEKALNLYELAQGRGLGDRVDLAKRIARVHHLLGRTAESLRHWHALARRCEEAQNRPQAIEAYRAALALDPVNVEAHEKLARLLVESDRKDEAATQLRFLIEELGRSDPPDAGKLVHAYEELLKLAPEDEAALRRISELHVERGDTVHAIVRLDELAQALIARSAREDAVAVYYRVLEIDEECLEGRLSLAQCLAQLGSTDDAVREYRRLADTLYKSGLIANSINWSFLFKVYESIVEIEPASTPAWEWLAKAYAENGQTDLAISRYLGMAKSLQPKDEGTKPPVTIVAPLRKVVELNPENTEVRRQLANALRALDKVPEAVRELHDLAQVHVAHGNSPAAIDALDEGLHADPFHLDSRKLVADLHERAEEMDAAFTAWADLGVLALRGGLHGDANEAFRHALAIKPDDAAVLLECARAEELRGRTTEAALLYGKLAQVETAAENLGRARFAQEKYRDLSRPTTGSGVRPGTGSRSSGRLAAAAPPSAPLPPMPVTPPSSRFSLHSPSSSGRFKAADALAADPPTPRPPAAPVNGGADPDRPTRSYPIVPPVPPKKTGRDLEVEAG